MSKQILTIEETVSELTAFVNEIAKTVEKYAFAGQETAVAKGDTGYVRYEVINRTHPLPVEFVAAALSLRLPPKDKPGAPF